MNSQVVKRSILLAGHKTSVSLEDAFWKALKEIATERDMALSVDRKRGGLTNAQPRGGRARLPPSLDFATPSLTAA
jgi:hypothetical protein